MNNIEQRRRKNHLKAIFTDKTLKSHLFFFVNAHSVQHWLNKFTDIEYNIKMD